MVELTFRYLIKGDMGNKKTLQKGSAITFGLSVKTENKRGRERKRKDDYRKGRRRPQKKKKEPISQCNHLEEQTPGATLN